MVDKSKKGLFKSSGILIKMVRGDMSKVQKSAKKLKSEKQTNQDLCILVFSI